MMDNIINFDKRNAGNISAGEVKMDILPSLPLQSSPPPFHSTLIRDIAFAGRVSILRGSYLNMLLLCGPFAILGSRGAFSFVMAVLTLVPSAERQVCYCSVIF